MRSALLASYVLMAANLRAIKADNIRNHTGGAKYIKRRRWRHGKFKR